MLREVMLCVIEVLGGLQQRLRGNTAYVGTGATQCRLIRSVLPFINTGGLETQLRSANRRHITARAATNNHYVKLFHVFLSSPNAVMCLS